MIIKELQLHNFSRHREIHFSPQGSVIGVLGGNGSGKSSVLSALEFSLTGLLPDTQESFVLQGETQGSVEMSFQHQGRDYTVFRGIGKNPRRWLQTPEQKITAAREIDRVLSEILAVDRRTLGNAVFIRQGTMTDILFAAYAERRNQLMTLTGLQYLAARVPHLIRTRDHLREGVVDLRAALEAARDRIGKAESERDQAVTLVSRTLDVTAPLAEAREQLRQHQDLVRMERQLQTLSLNLEEKFSQEEAAAHRLGHPLGHWLDRNKEINRLLPLVSEEIRSYYQTLMAWKSYDQLFQENTQAVAAVLAAQKEVVELEFATGGTLEQLGQRQDRIRESLTLQRQIRNLTIQVKNFQKRLGEARSAYAGLKSPDPVPPEEMEMWVQKEKMVGWMGEQYRMQEELSRCIPQGNTRCPKCGLEVKDFSPLSPENLKTLQQHLLELGNWCSSERIRIQHIQSERLRIEQEKASRLSFMGLAHQDLAAAEKELAMAEKELQTREPAATEELLQHISGWGEKLRNARARSLSLEKLAQQKSMAVVDLSNTLDFTKRGFYSLEGYQALQRKNQNLLEEQPKVQANIMLLQNLSSAIIQIRLQETELKQQLQTAPVPDLTPEQCDQLPLQIQGMEMQQQMRHQCLGALAQATRALEQCQSELSTLEASQRSQERRARAVSDMDLLIPLFQEEGLALKCLQQLFGRLQGLTQGWLEQMEARFRLFEPDLQKLEMRYQVSGQGSQPLPASKLSGGMRVRVSLAFLLAVQRLLIPEVGLLVLDEPSTHLDGDGVEALAQLLQKLGGAFASSGFSVWVADHHETLQRSVSDSLLLDAI